MDRTMFAACAVLALPLAALTIGCDAPSKSSSSAEITPPAVLVELQSMSPGPWRRPSDAPITVAVKLVEPVGVPSGPAGSADVPSDIPPHIAAPSLESTPTRPPIAPQAVEGVDAPNALQEDAQSTAVPSDASAAGDSNAQFLMPSGGLEIASPSVEDKSESQLEVRAPAEVSIPEVNDTATSATSSARAAIVSAQAAVPRSALPWASAEPRRPEMIAVVQRADARVRHGFQLAERGALYSARAEMLAALQLIAQANDAQQNTRLYTKALAGGLMALKESSDFVRSRPGKEEVDVARAVGAHKTPVLKNAPLDEIASMQAVQRYYNYAQEQLGVAAAQETTGSIALFGLAKVVIASAGNNKSQQLECTAQAMAFYQAALLAAPRNFLAANELAVLLAQNGSLSPARELLMRSAALSPHAATWKNLAAVHAWLGEAQLAEHAKAQALALEQAGKTGVKPEVQWVDADTFASLAPVSDTLLPAVASVKAPAPAASAAAKPAAETAKKGISDWLPWNPRR